MNGPVWRVLRRAGRVAYAVRTSFIGLKRLAGVNPPKSAASARKVERLAAEQFAYALSAELPETRRLALTWLAVRAAKNEPLAESELVARLWKRLERLDRAITPKARPRTDRTATWPPLPVEEAKQVPIDQLLGALGIDLRGSGNTRKGLCPFHPDTHPSLSVNVERGLWYCGPCAMGGDGIRFVQRFRRVSFAAAVREVVACARA